jgi:proline iminopeptidase
MSIAQTFFQAADVILFDPRGCGRSESCHVKYCSLEHYIDDVEAIRKHFDINPLNFFVFGQSYGSIAALGYATCYPSSLKKLLLIGGVVSSSFYEEAQTKLKEIGTPEQIVFSEKLWHGTFDGSKEEIADFYRLMSPLYSYSFEPGEPPLEMGYNIDIMNEGWGNFLKHFDYKNELSKITCETLILWGEDEWIMPKSHVDLLSKRIPHGALKVYPKCMHMLWIDQWDIFTHDALEFLR